MPGSLSENACLSCICDDKRVFRHPLLAMAVIVDLSELQLTGRVEAEQCPVTE